MIVDLPAWTDFEVMVHLGRPTEAKRFEAVHVHITEAQYHLLIICTKSATKGNQSDK